MYFIVGTRMTKTLLRAIIMAAIRKCLIQLNGLLGNNSVVTDVRICNRKVQRQGQCFVLFFYWKFSYNVMLVSSTQQIDSIIHIYFMYLYMYMYITYIYTYIIHIQLYIFNYTYNYTYLCMTIYIVFQILFHYRLLQDIDYNFPSYTVGPCFYLFYI